MRIEGWEYAPVLEFDPFFPATATAKPDAREFIVDDIKKSRHYENKVEPLALGGDDKAVRVLVMLHPRPADQLHARGRHDAIRDLAVHVELRRLGQGEAYPGDAPRARCR